MYRPKFVPLASPWHKVTASFQITLAKCCQPGAATFGITTLSLPILGRMTPNSIFECKESLFHYSAE
jgi:hypothetical protein